MTSHFHRLFFAAVAVFLFASAGGASAYTYKVIHSFCADAQCTDGSTPSGNLLPDGEGGFYGATSTGGPTGGGTIYHVSPNGADWSLSVLYSFCIKHDCPSFTDVGDLLMDGSGNLYGVDGGSSTNPCGTVFELIPNAHKTKWHIVTRYKFCSEPDWADGRNPIGLTYVGRASGLDYDGASPLFGVTSSGGANGGGVAFKLTPVPDKSKWKEAVLHDFCAPNCHTDLWMPNPPVADAAGNLFGTAQNGSPSGGGGVYKITAGKKHPKESIVFSCDTGCKDSSTPYGTLLLESDGSLIGNFPDDVLKLTPHGQGYDVTSLHRFCNGFTCPDGRFPKGSLAMDASGHLFGTTIEGGNTTEEGIEAGVAYAIDPNYTVLHKFCQTGDEQCTDGMNPLYGLVIDSAGNLFGTTRLGGKGGVLFEISP